MNSIIHRYENETEMRRYRINKILEEDKLTSFGQLHSRQRSARRYNNFCLNSTNMFAVSDDGNSTICSFENVLYLEKWNRNINSPSRIIELFNEMDNKITFVNVDFQRDFVVSGDEKGYFMIQRISKNVILFHKTRIFKREQMLISSSIFNNYLCVGDNNHNIETINLNHFAREPRLSFRSDSQLVNSLQIMRIDTNIYLIASGKNNILSLTFLILI
jgi:hypothetical protein